MTRHPYIKAIRAIAGTAQHLPGAWNYQREVLAHIAADAGNDESAQSLASNLEDLAFRGHTSALCERDRELEACLLKACLWLAAELSEEVEAAARWASA